VDSATSLNLSSNWLTLWPGGDDVTSNQEVGCLRALHLDHNRISHVRPAAFVRMRELRQLALNHNDIDTLDPKTFTGLVLLEELDMSFNKITVLPEMIFWSLSQLRVMYGKRTR